MANHVALLIHRRSIALVTLTAGMTAAGVASADEPEPIRVEYAVAAGCPAEASFVAEVRARTARAVVVESGERRVFAVGVTRAPGGAFRGTLTVRAAERASKRDVEGRSCGEVVSALALIAALAVDPRASTKPVEQLPAEPPPAIAEPPPEPPPPPPPPPQVTQPEPVPEVRAEIGPPVAPVESAIHEARVQISAGADAELRSGVLPRGAPAIGPFLAVANETSSIWSPSARLSGRAAPGQSTEVSGARADLGWAAARLELCPLRVRLARTLSTRPCAVGEVGVLTARGVGLLDAQDETRFWSAAGGSLHTTWEVSSRFFASSSLTALVPLRRDRFYAAPGTTFFDVPFMGFAIGIGIGVLLFS